MIKGIGYCRVSTREQADEGVSLKNQEEKIRAYCQLNDIELIDIIVDEGETWKDLRRSVIQALLSKLNHANALIIYKIDRIHLYASDMIEIAEKLEKKKISIHSVTEKVDTKTAVGRAFFQILTAYEEYKRNSVEEINQEKK